MIRQAFRGSPGISSCGPIPSQSSSDSHRHPRTSQASIARRTFVRTNPLGLATGLDAAEEDLPTCLI